MRFQLLSSIHQISPTQWDPLTNGQILLSHAFLSALEDSHSVCPETGWQPCHLILKEKSKLIGAMPLYLKAHSQGEYIFDHSWADALERSGAPYYPKLLCGVPFTPVTGSRLLCQPKHYPTMLAAALQATQKLKASSLHIHFPRETEWQTLTNLGLMARTGYQFHWRNQNYQHFDDFLSTLTSRRRKNIRKERATAQKGLAIKHCTGTDLTEILWDHFFAFYMDTGSRKWGRPYLTRECFSLLSERLANQTLLIIAESDGTPIAGALNFIDEDRLYGRYWGCTEYHRFLHFELSYYQAIDYAIAHQMKIVEAGAQGQHKMERGYAPVKTYSAHHIAHDGLAHAVNNYLQQENHAVDMEISYLDDSMPFRQS